MSFISGIFGDSGNSLLTAVFALGAVIIAIFLLLWLLKLLFGAGSRVARGRNRRLAVVDSLALDPKRQLLIIRRDDVEHLILTGGPQDVVVETGIAVAETPAAAQPTRRPIPMVATRKPAPPRATAPIVPPAPTPAQPAPASARPAGGATAIEQLRELGQPVNQRTHLSLRHTGLLRPVSEMEMAVSPENSAATVLSGAD